jgi:hypothetical protein
MTKTLFQKWLGLMKNRAILIVYFSLWFCALTFYSEDALHVQPSQVTGYGFAILQAVMLSKFLLIPEGLLPYGLISKRTEKSALYLAIITRTTFVSVATLCIRYLVIGLEGLLKGNGFIESMSAFGQGDIKHILATLCMYWLIVLPYMCYRFLIYLAGDKDLATFLSERRAQS